MDKNVPNSKVNIFFKSIVESIKNIINSIGPRFKRITIFIFYLLVLYLVGLSIYFAIKSIYKVILIIKDLMFENDYMVALDLLSNNCYLYSSNENFTNPNEKLIENFDTSMIMPSTLNGEVVKKIYDIPIQYYNSNLKKFMDLKICDFYWPCSYRSYLSGSYEDGKPSYKAIIDSFNVYNVRLIHLDVYGSSESFTDENNVPVVRSETMYYNFDALDFHKCLTTINTNAWKDNNHKPLFIYLNMKFPSNKILYEKIYYALMKVFYKKLVDKKYSFAGRSSIAPIGSITINDAIDKVIILSSVYPTRTKLDEIINAYVNVDNGYCSINEYLDDYKSYGGLVNSTNANNLVDTYRSNIGVYFSYDSSSQTNITNNSKGKIANPDFLDCAKYGSQMALMSLYSPDSYLNSWFFTFKKNNFNPILKASSLRYIPTSITKLTQQDPTLSYAQSTYNMPVSGFFSTSLANIST